jgi:GNAT superfamily N-acetyltransferase
MRIERYAPTWHSKVIDLAKEAFGEGYFSKPGEIAGDPDTIMLVSNETDGSLLGLVQGRLLPENALAEYLEHKVSDVPDEVAAADRDGALGVIEIVAVAESQRGTGLGTRLISSMHDALIGHGADKLIVSFKHGPSASRVDGLMKKLGFEPWTRLPSYWQAECDAGEFKCVDRTDHCTCEALLYRKSVY